MQEAFSFLLIKVTQKTKSSAGQDNQKGTQVNSKFSVKLIVQKKVNTADLKCFS